MTHATLLTPFLTYVPYIHILPLLDVEGQPLDGAGGGGGPMLNQPWVMPPDGMGKGVDGAAGPGQWIALMMTMMMMMVVVVMMIMVTENLLLVIAYLLL